MAKFRRKSFIVEAVQFLPDSDHKFKLPNKVRGIQSPNADNWAYAGCVFYINAFDRIYPGDWITYWNDGSPCSVLDPISFANQYEWINDTR